jgi:cytochrome c-type biogenesis protein CcmH
MLARSYSVLGKHAQALPAYKKALALRQGDPTLIADYADSLAKNSSLGLQGEPMKQVETALKLDPRNLKALSLAGADVFERKDYAAAVRFWEKLAQYGPAQDIIVQQVAPRLASARELAGTPRKDSAVVAN